MLLNTNEYFEVLETIKTQIKAAQHKAVLGANREMILLYWQIGKTIIANTKYGAKFVENLSRDILSEFPEIQGFSVRNLKYMRKFAETHPDLQKVQQGVALLSWSHNTLLLDKAKTQKEIIWHAKQTIENGWSLSAKDTNQQNCISRSNRCKRSLVNVSQLLVLQESTLRGIVISIVPFRQDRECLSLPDRMLPFRGTSFHRLAVSLRAGQRLPT